MRACSCNLVNLCEGRRKEKEGEGHAKKPIFPNTRKEKEGEGRRRKEKEGEGRRRKGE